LGWGSRALRWGPRLPWATPPLAGVVMYDMASAAMG
jgi:hypothetical protein